MGKTINHIDIAQNTPQNAIFMLFYHKNFFQGACPQIPQQTCNFIVEWVHPPLNKLLGLPMREDYDKDTTPTSYKFVVQYEHRVYLNDQVLLFGIPL